MESLDSVGNILRHKNRHDLASLLSRASLDFEYVDIGFLIGGADGVVEMVNAAIFAPYSDCERLRALPREDCELMLECLSEIWPYRGSFSGMAILDVVYHVDPHAVEDGPKTFSSRSPAGLGWTGPWTRSGHGCGSHRMRNSSRRWECSVVRR